MKLFSISKCENTGYNEYWFLGILFEKYSEPNARFVHFGNVWFGFGKNHKNKTLCGVGFGEDSYMRFHEEKILPLSGC